MNWTTLIFLAFVVQQIVATNSELERARRGSNPVVVTNVCLARCAKKFCSLGMKFRAYCHKCEDICISVGEHIAVGARGKCIPLCTPQYPKSNWLIKKMVGFCKKYCSLKYKGGEKMHMDNCIYGCSPEFPITSEPLEKKIRSCVDYCSDKGKTGDCKRLCKPEYDLKRNELVALWKTCERYCNGRDNDPVMYRDNVCVYGCMPVYPKDTFEVQDRTRACKKSCLLLPKDLTPLGYEW